jgi:hypothetical protein
VLSPTITASDIASKIVSKPGHFDIESQDERLMNLGYKAKPFFLQNFFHFASPIFWRGLKPNFITPVIIVSGCAK